jgi:hypothetical protein
MQRLCKINILAMHTELEHQALNEEEAARQLCDAIDTVKTLENAIDRRKARVYLDLKYPPEPSPTEQLEESIENPQAKPPKAIKAPSDKAIEYLQDLDPIVVELKDDLVIATSLMKYLERVCNAIAGRNTMLVNLRKKEDAEAGVQRQR